MEKILNEHVKMAEHLEAYDKELKKREKELEVERRQFESKKKMVPDFLRLVLVKRNIAQLITMLFCAF